MYSVYKARARLPTNDFDYMQLGCMRPCSKLNIILCHSTVYMYCVYDIICWKHNSKFFNSGRTMRLMYMYVISAYYRILYSWLCRVRREFQGPLWLDFATTCTVIAAIKKQLRLISWHNAFNVHAEKRLYYKPLKYIRTLFCPNNNCIHVRIHAHVQAHVQYVHVL